MAAATVQSPPRILGFPLPRRTRVPYTWLGRGLYLGSLAPLASLTLRAVTDGLGANPIAEVENELGLTALIFLVATMACTPAKRILHWTWPLRIRRQLGLWAFTYASLHFLTYLLIDQFLDFGAILADIVQRPFITVGFAALVLLVPIAVTSTNDWVKRLGYQRWLRLHQLVYVVVALVAVHFIWRVKADISQPLTYAIILGSLLGVRLLFWLAKQRRSGAVSGPHPGK
jgi:sulfoxide reductase heme-binding subunit YedZ